MSNLPSDRVRTSQPITTLLGFPKIGTVMVVTDNSPSSHPLRRHNKLTTCVAAVLLTLCATSLGNSLTADAKKGLETTSVSPSEKCWLFSQNTDEFGDIEVTVATTGLKVDCMRGTCRIIRENRLGMYKYVTFKISVLCGSRTRNGPKEVWN